MTENNNHGTTMTRPTARTPARWRPSDELTEMRRQVDDAFGRIFGYSPLTQLIPAEVIAYDPVVDIYETTDKILIFASLPGYTPENINVEANGDSITFYGERKPLLHEEKAIPHKQVGLVNAGSFRASYTLPVEVDPGKACASFDHGVLKLELPKTERARAKTIKIAVVHPK